MASFLTAGSLARVIDDHIQWFVAWHRLAVCDTATRVVQAQRLGTPDSFSDWYEQAVTSLPQDQPLMDRLAVTHDALHKLARLTLVKTPDGQVIDAADYGALTDKYREFLRGARQLERAFAVAASGLDLLTGLRSRVGMHEDLMREQSRFLRGGKPFCVAVMDIDHFSRVNERHGHEVGDRALEAMADHVSRSLRVFDDAYRLGGEEFLLFLKEADLATGLAVLDRLRSGLGDAAITLPDGDKLHLTASFGLSAILRDMTVEELLHRADQALYRAKTEGRNRIAVLGED